MPSAARREREELIRKTLSLGRKRAGPVLSCWWRKQTVRQPRASLVTISFTLLPELPLDESLSVEPTSEPSSAAQLILVSKRTSSKPLVFHWRMVWVKKRYFNQGEMQSKDLCA